MQRVTILGSTGSIGTSTLDVIARNPELYQVFALVAGKNWQLMVEQCKQFLPQYAVMQDAEAAQQLSQYVAQQGLPVTVLSGEQSACDVASDESVDSVMAAIVGAAGLMPTLAAIKAGKRVLLANKESLVMSGELFINEVKHSGATLLPIDSEHNAIFQAMPSSVQENCFSANLAQHGVSKILLTGSGGPFRTRDLNTFANISVDEAVAHPNWDMGKKISVDSATMMNKGLEFIEAKWLFNAEPDDIQVVIHPQSIIHSMVQYTDGSVLAQMGNPDMRTPIAHALAFPKRIDAGVAPLDFTQMVDFSFIAPDFERYPNLKLAIDACSEGQYATTAINAANEQSVAAFLENKIGFLDIYRINSQVLNEIAKQHKHLAINNLDEILQLDSEARALANNMITGSC
ncbi:1-deoxy-D-xylulose-5-phosphate reductoisomerase [Pseudoalteromonas sp. SSM20]|uniref:1-deoxy-D-xylulose-5-phosphate reductoisomerase n=1 Tax=Pseudoalteromonas sp. SSM20 TaxID=3139394 RepID=UPI003BA94F5C